MIDFDDVAGVTSGVLVAVADAGPDPHGRKLVRCKCACGNVCTVLLSKFMRGEVTSCGCHSGRGRKRSAWCRSKEGAEKMLTAPARKDSASGHRGVSTDSSTGKWVAAITYQGKRRFLGRFDDKEDAIQARLAAERELLRDIEKDEARRKPEKKSGM